MLENKEYFTARDANILATERKKAIISSEYDVKCVLDEIREASQNGFFEIEIVNDENIREKLLILGYTCSQPFKKRNDDYIKVSWFNYLF